MVPVLSLFLMCAAAKTLELAWKRANIEVLTVAHTPANELNWLRVRPHPKNVHLVQPHHLQNIPASIR